LLLYHQLRFALRARGSRARAGAPRCLARLGRPLKLKPFVKAARTLRRHRDGILAAIRLGLSNGRLEGLNSRVRLISHRSFGFHSAAPRRADLPLLRRHQHRPPAPMTATQTLQAPKIILADARRARNRVAQIVIVNLRWGDEYRHAPSAFQRSLARRLLRSRAITAIIGQHVHVVQPITKAAGRLVVYGEGNLLSNQTAARCPPASRDGLIALLQIA
jgi:hypothetical protein